MRKEEHETMRNGTIRSNQTWNVADISFSVCKRTIRHIIRDISTSPEYSCKLNCNAFIRYKMQLCECEWECHGICHSPVSIFFFFFFLFIFYFAATNENCIKNFKLRCERQFGRIFFEIMMNLKSYKFCKTHACIYCWWNFTLLFVWLWAIFTSFHMIPCSSIIYKADC